MLQAKIVPLYMSKQGEIGNFIIAAVTELSYSISPHRGVSNYVLRLFPRGYNCKNVILTLTCIKNFDVKRLSYRLVSKTIVYTEKNQYL